MMMMMIMILMTMMMVFLRLAIINRILLILVLYQADCVWAVEQPFGWKPTFAHQNMEC